MRSSGTGVARRAISRVAWALSLASSWIALPHTVLADPPPVITSYEVTSYSTGDTRSIRLPQTTIPLITVRGSHFFPSGTTGPAVILHRQGYQDRFNLPWMGNLSMGTDAQGDWVKVRNFNLAGMPPGTWDLILQRPPSSNPGQVTIPGAVELLPQASEHLETRASWGGIVNAVQRVGNTIYVGAGRRLVALDATDEQHLVELGSIDLRGVVLDLQVRGTMAYVAADNRWVAGLCVVDITNPGAMSVLWTSSQLCTNGCTSLQVPSSMSLNPVRVWLNGSYAYVMEYGNNYIAVFSLANPASPAYLGHIDEVLLGGSTDWKSIDGSRLYVVNQPLGTVAPGKLRIFDLSSGTPLAPTLMGEVVIDDPSYSINMTVDAGCAQASRVVLRYRRDFNGVSETTPWTATFDVSTSSAPVRLSNTQDSVVGTLPAPTTLSDLAVSPGYLLATEDEWVVKYPDPTRGLLVYDIATNPAHPQLVSTFKTHGTLHKVTVIGNRAYVADRGEGLIIFDISNPAQPVRLGGFFSPAGVRDVARNGDFLYVADVWNGFTILDISDVTHPRVRGIYQVDQTNRPDLGDMWGIAYSNGHVYLGVGIDFYDLQALNPRMGIDVVNVSNPDAPALVLAYDLPGYANAWGLEVRPGSEGGILTAGIWTNPTGGIPAQPELWNFDISTPALMHPIGTVQFPKTAPNEKTWVTSVQTVGGFTMTTRGLVDNRNPAAPVLVESAAQSVPPSVVQWPYVTGVAYDGNLIYGITEDLRHDYPAPGLGGWDYVFSIKTAANAVGQSSPAANIGPWQLPKPQPARAIMDDVGYVNGTTVISGTYDAIAQNGAGRLFLLGALNNVTQTATASSVPVTLHMFSITEDPRSPRLIASMTGEAPAGFGGFKCAHISSYDPTTAKKTLRVFGNLVAVGMGNALDWDPGLVLIEDVVQRGADRSGDDPATIQEAAAFLRAYASGMPAADLNRDGRITTEDYLLFLKRSTPPAASGPRRPQGGSGGE